MLKNLSQAKVTIDSPLLQLDGVNKQLADKLAKLNLRTLQDLAFHLPIRYQDRTRIVALADLKLGQEALIQGKVFAVKLIPGKKISLVVEIIDASGGSLELKFFYFNKAQVVKFKTLPYLRCYGEIKKGYRRYTIIHPEYKIIDPADPLILAEHLDPVYPTVDGLTQPKLRKIIRYGLELILANNLLVEYLPKKILENYKLLPLLDALEALHFPNSGININNLEIMQNSAKKRLIFEELLANNLAMLSMRNLQQQRKAIVINDSSGILNKFFSELTFELTGAQMRVINEIQHDLCKPRPMLRLLQGDVGSGKTVVAVVSMLSMINSGYQVACLAPTELLAEQHYKNINLWLSKLDIKVELLLAKTKATDKKNIKNNLIDNTLQVVIGTHALLQEDVKFANLALVIIDEQHRFGVEQRLALWEKGNYGDYAAHQLIMTATPIPRTLAMTAYANLDYSVIDELPKGRQPIETVAIPNDRRGEILDRVKLVCLNGGQVYWVCTLITESEVLEATAAEEAWEKLAIELRECKVGLIHGRMPGLDKEKIMEDFKNNLIQVLVATTVIEVGIDVPNANLMIIENPERLGLAQLHQLRGRVGRGNRASFCVLLYNPPLADRAYQRLDILRSCQDGFIISQKDWQLRGAGELLGKKQAGNWQLKIADLSRDYKILPDIKAVAEILNSQYPENAEGLMRRWLVKSEEYGSV